jgi:hypothetical protein
MGRVREDGKELKEEEEDLNTCGNVHQAPTTTTRHTHSFPPYLFCFYFIW